MKVIVIEENRFEKEFERTIVKLQLERFTSEDDERNYESSPVGKLHTIYQKEIHDLKRRLQYS